MPESTRERSSIKFPYGALSDAEQVAQAVWSFGLDCSIDQLAAAMHQNLSGAFRNKVATASTFGVVETSRGRVALTELGERLVDPETAASARVDAFLQVPLYEQVFDTFRGRRLPGDQGLEAELVKFGVSKKQAPKARQAMIRSAEQAGFFLHGRDRLVEPANVRDVRQVSDSDSGQFGEGESVAKMQKLDPLIVGLLARLPDPKAGTFTTEQQDEWLTVAAGILRLMYGSGDAKPRTLGALKAPPAPNG